MSGTRTGTGRAMGGLVLSSLLVVVGCGEPSGTADTPAIATAPVELSPLERLEAAVLATPDDATAWSELARERLEAEDANGASEAAVRALELSETPAAVDADTLAHAHIAAERWEEARSALTQLIEIDPEHPRAQLELARVEEHLGHAEAAEAAYRAALGSTEVVDDDGAQSAGDEDVEARLHLASLLIARCRRPRLQGTYTEDVDAPLRTEVRTLLAAARANLDEDDPRRGAIAAYEEDLAELETEAAARLAQAAAVERTQLDVNRMLLGGLGNGSALRDVLAQQGSTLDALGQAEGIGVATSGGGLRQRGMGGGGLGRTGAGQLGGLGGGALSRRPSASAGLATVRVRVTAGSTGGLQTAAVTRIAQRHTEAFRRCHASAARREPALAGSVVVNFTVSEAGAVERASVSGTARSGALQDCGRSVVMRIAFPTAEGPSRGSITATFQPAGSP